jgi:hypothetical protein
MGNRKQEPEYRIQEPEEKKIRRRACSLFILDSGF